MTLPNLTMRSIYIDCYNQLHHIERNSVRYIPTYERFVEDRRFEPLVQNYFEQNNAAGRSDFEMTGIPGTEYYKDDRVVEFKYFKAREAEKMMGLSVPRPEDVEQVRKYAEDTRQKFPAYHVRPYVAYICANRGWKCWEI